MKLSSEQISAISNACEYAVRHTESISGKRHGASYIWYKLIGFFEKEPAATSVIMDCEVRLNGILRGGKVEIDRNGYKAIRLCHEDE